MKASFKSVITLIILLLSLGFAKDGIIELESYLNGRSSANFLKDANNVKFTLPPGTRAKIQETKKFNSGNYGLKVEVASGPRKGESVWVYYRTADPGVKIFENEKAAKKDQEVKSVEKATVAKTTREHEAIRDPASMPKKAEAAQSQVSAKPAIAEKTATKPSKQLDKEDAEETVRKVTDANSALQKHGKPGGPCSECDLQKVHSRDVGVEEEKKTVFAAKASQDPAVMILPSRTQNPFGVRSTRCNTYAGAVDYCTFEGDSEPGKFKFRNSGPNKIVSGGDLNRAREWEFNFEGNARQDLGLSISDMPNGTISQTQESFIMVFPRKTLPSIRTVGNRQIVTLPTGETVTFDTQTKQVIGGVLSENGAMTNGGKSLQPAKVSYHGNGVMVRVDTRGNDPRLSADTAVITRQGKTCSVQAKKLWSDRSGRSAAHFKYFSDADFDSFLKTTCGFGL